jgi:hypothetical protein
MNPSFERAFDTVGPTGFPPRRLTANSSILDAVGLEIHPEKEFWARENRVFLSVSRGSSILMPTLTTSCTVRH